MAAQAGFAPAPFRLTGGRTTVIPLSKMLIGGRALRVFTGGANSVSRLRSDSNEPTSLLKKWSPRQDLHLRSPGPRPGMLLLHYAVLPRLIGKGSRGLVSLWRRGLAAPWGYRRVGDWRSRWDLHPHSTRRQRVAFLFSYESWWEVLVTLQFVASDLV